MQVAVYVKICSSYQAMKKYFLSAHMYLSLLEITKLIEQGLTSHQTHYRSYRPQYDL